MRYLIFLLTLFVYGATALAFETGPPITDREIIESLTELKAGQVSLDRRFDDMGRRIDDGYDKLDKRIDDLSNLVLWGFGVIFAGIFALIGFILWDRRTALAPSVKKN